MLILFSSAVAIVLGSTVAAPADASRPPNVIIVMTDDQGLGDFSFTGNPVLKTPNFDSFARQAVRFTDFHVCPMCSPTRGQLLTGVSALRNGATSVTAGRTFLRPGLPTLAEAFAQAGYKTGLFGKWHLGDHFPHRPIDKGFQESFYHLGWGQLNSTPEFDWPLIDGRCFHNGVEQRYQGHCTDFWFDSAMSWMKQCREQHEPFFCYLPTNAPHGPCLDLEEYVEPYRGKGPAGFFGMIAHLDKRFGDLEKFLVDQKLRDDTIVIFMTDNGGTAGVPVFNAGLRGHKTEYYEGGHRTACWIRWPNGNFGTPRDIDDPAQNIDIYPTLVELCGLRLGAGGQAVDALYRGNSLASVLKGADLHLPDRMFVVQYGQIPQKYECCVVGGNWRLVNGKELYDVATDRSQKVDVAARHADVVRAMREYYERWWAGVEPMLADFVPISIGASQQPVVELTSGDWENIYADNTGHVREAVGGPTGGYWCIKVEEPGRYEFMLRRWPSQTRQRLGDKYEPTDKSPAVKAQLTTRSFPTIAQANLEIAGLRAEFSAEPGELGAPIEINLPSGVTRLKAWFADAQGNNLCGAFFVTVKKVK